MTTVPTAPPWLRLLLPLLALALGAVHTTVAMVSQSMNEDGIGYLDMGDAWMRGDWDMAVNGTWSPLYSWLLGGVVHLLQPSIRQEFPAVQATNFFIYAIALLCFRYFWKELTLRYYAMPGEVAAIRFHPGAWLALGYSLFIWVSLDLIEIWAVNPDMAVAAFVYLAAGLMLRLAGGRATVASALLLGLVLGGAYLAKAAMMPLGVACLMLALLVPAGALGRWRRLALSASVFLVVAMPLLTALSLRQGAPTFSDVGRFTYLKHVNEMRYPDFMPDVARLDGSPSHPPRRIFDDPPVWEFAQPIGGTYPMGYDPAWWTQGLHPTVALGPQLRAIATNAIEYFDLFLRRQGGFVATLLVLGAMSLWLLPRRSWLSSELLLAAWGCAALGLYSLVHVTPRYIAPFVLLLFAAPLADMRLPDLAACRRLMTVCAASLLAFTWINIGALNLEGFARLIGFTPLSESGPRVGQVTGKRRGSHPAVAEALLAQGLARGDEVGFIGYSFSAFWARLARVRIIAEIHPEYIADFWRADEARRAAVLQAFAASGAVAVIAEPIDAAAPPPGWTEIGDTGYLLYLLK